MESQTQVPAWKCGICAVFVALTLRALMNHYYSVHSNNPNFSVRCGVDDCPARFRKYHSFYKHVVRKHNDKYNIRFEDILDTPPGPAGPENQHDQDELNDGDTIQQDNESEKDPSSSSNDSDSDNCDSDDSATETFQQAEDPEVF